MDVCEHLKGVSITVFAPKNRTSLIANYFREINVHATYVDSITRETPLNVNRSTDQPSLYLVDHNLMSNVHNKRTYTANTKSAVLFFYASSSDCTLSLNETYHCINIPQTSSELSKHCQMALFKRRVQTKSLEQQELLNKAISCVGETLIYVNSDLEVISTNSEADLFFGCSTYTKKSLTDYLTVSREALAEQFVQFIKAAINTRAVTKIQPTAFTVASGKRLLFDGLIGPYSINEAQQGAVIILREMDIINTIPEELNLNNSASTSSNTRSVLLINPDDFKQINERYDWQQGDLILNEIESRLKKCLRASDFSCRYSGAFFLVILNDINEIQAINVINQLQKELVDKCYLANKAKLSFSFGFALNNHSLDYTLMELFYFANTSLSKAIEFGGEQMQQWQQPTTLQQIGNFDRINGGFFQQGSIVYRKMITLWELLNRIDINGDLNLFSQQLNSVLVTALNLQNSAFYILHDNEVDWLNGINNKQINNVVSDSQLTEKQRLFANKNNEKIGHNPLIDVTHQGKLFTVLIKITIDDAHSVLLKLDGEEVSLPAFDNQDLLHKLSDFIRVSIQKIKLKHTFNKSSAVNSKNSKAKEFWFVSKEMEALMHDVSMVAHTEATVLITGESGTGKEFLAQKIHDLSARKDKPFIIFDCSTIVSTLIESELFGHKKGAFTGADRAVDGCIKQAEGGTLFLDEVGELALETQVKLLRFIQEKQYSPVGDGSYKIADVRIISATNVDLEKQMQLGKFREDLYYRLNVFNVSTPPLRNRQEDILLLAMKFLNVYRKEYNKQTVGFDTNAQIALMQYKWPGNVRELKNLIHKAIILCDQKQISCTHLGIYPQHDAIDKVNRKTVLSVSEERSSNQALALVDESNKVVFNPNSTLLKAADTELLVDDLQLLILSMIKSGYVNCKGLVNLLERSLYHSALESTHNITLQAAKLIHVSESTFRRRWQTLKTFDPKVDYSQEIIDSIVQKLIALSERYSKPARLKEQFIAVCEQLNVPAKYGALMLGVTVATYRKQAKTIELQR